MDNPAVQLLLGAEKRMTECVRIPLDYIVA